MKPIPPDSAVARYFAGLAENTFQIRLGVVDPPMVDYVTDLLIRFIRLDTLHRVRSSTGRPLISVTEMAAEASARLGDARRRIHQHIGDFTLFWAGVYPEALRARASQDQFEDYCSHGKRAYLIASSMDAAEEDEPPSEVLHRLSERFELCAYGLREIRREWEEGEEHGPGTGAILLN